MEVSHVDQVLVTPGVGLRQRCDIRTGPAPLWVTDIRASQRVGSGRTRFAQSVTDQVALNRCMARRRYRVIRLMAKVTRKAGRPGVGSARYVPADRRSRGK